MASITFTTEQFNQLIGSIGQTKGKKKLNTQLEKVQRLMETSDEVSCDDIMKLFKTNKSSGKKTQNSWQLFVAEVRETFEPGMNGKDILAKASGIWKEMSDEDKQPYKDAAEKLKNDKDSDSDSDNSEPNVEDKKQEIMKELFEPSDDEQEVSEPEVEQEVSEPEVEAEVSDEEQKPKKKRTSKPKEKVDMEIIEDLDDDDWESLTFDDGKSEKFWKAITVEEKLFVHYGKIGSKGTYQQKTFESDEDAKKQLLKDISGKKKKGYYN